MAQYGFSTSTKIDDPLSPFIRPADTQVEDYRKQTGDLFGAIQDRLLKSQSDMATTKQAGLNTAFNTLLTAGTREKGALTALLKSPIFREKLRGMITDEVIGDEESRGAIQNIGNLADTRKKLIGAGIFNRIAPGMTLAQIVGGPDTKRNIGPPLSIMEKMTPDPIQLTTKEREDMSRGQGRQKIIKQQIGGLSPSGTMKILSGGGGTQPTTTGTQQAVQSQVDKMNQQINNVALDNNSQYAIDPSDPIQVTYKNGKYVLAGGTLINKRTGKSRKLVTSYQGKDIEINDSWVKQFKADMGVP